VRWDEEELRRVLVNLVGNAVQSIRTEGRVDVRARPHARGGRPGVTIEVADDGVGIPRENLERLFEPGFSTKTSGTGLGLAIVRGILDDMGGDVEVESHTGEGSTFRVWWPCVPEPTA
jgi:signal transduction histidine kinase